LLLSRKLRITNNCHSDLGAPPSVFEGGLLGFSVTAEIPHNKQPSFRAQRGIPLRSPTSIPRPVRAVPLHAFECPPRSLQRENNKLGDAQLSSCGRFTNPVRLLNTAAQMDGCSIFPACWFFLRLLDHQRGIGVAVFFLDGQIALENKQQITGDGPVFQRGVMTNLRCLFR
jgi:hypothetical protein